MKNLNFELMLDNCKHEVVDEIKEFITDYFEAPDSNENKSDWVKTQRVCEKLDCSPATVGRLRDDKLLPASLIHGTYYYRESDVDQMMENGRVS
jgi:hypothetical protein